MGPGFLDPAMAWNDWGRGRGRAGPANWAAAHDPANATVPHWLNRVGDRDEDGSILMIDNRDGRVVSPFQGFTPLEISENANSQINVLVERQNIMRANSGFFFTFFSVQTLRVFKLFIVVSMDTAQGAPCAAWDGPTRAGLMHPAFQPFEWPDMFDSTPTVVDIKIKVEGEVLQHVVLTAYRSDNDCTVTKNWFSDDLAAMISEGSVNCSITVAVFQGYRVSCCTVEPGGRLYSAGPNGAVLAGDFARCHVEVRKVVRNCADALGTDPDKIEFRYVDAANRIEVATARSSVPNSWVVASHVSGPAFTRIVEQIRTQNGRVEGPDQQMQLGQLRSLHANWFSGSVASQADRPRAVKKVIRCPASAQNVHLIWDSQLQFHAADVVSREALAIGGHDETVSAPAIFLPPQDGIGVQVVAAAPGSHNALQAALLPPLPADRAVFQPDNARVLGDHRPVLVNVEMDPVDRPVAVPPAPIATMDLSARRAQAKPKARAPGIPEYAIQAALDPNALSVGHRPLQDRIGGALEFPVVVIPPPEKEELDLLAELEFENESHRTLSAWIDQNPNSPGLENSNRQLLVHQNRIGELFGRINDFKAARQEAGWRFADQRNQRSAVTSGDPRSSGSQFHEEGPMIEEVPEVF